MSADIFGRDAELQALGALLDRIEQSAAAMVLAGPAGAGKTTLLRAGSRRAAERGCTVLATTPARSDMPLAFAGLADLLEVHLDGVIGALPRPQADALRAALLLAAPVSPPEPRLIATALRTALAALASSAPVVMVIEPWGSRSAGSNRSAWGCCARSERTSPARTCPWSWAARG